jgi:hypothetical protein
MEISMPTFFDTEIEKMCEKDLSETEAAYIMGSNFHGSRSATSLIGAHHAALNGAALIPFRKRELLFRRATHLLVYVPIVSFDTLVNASGGYVKIDAALGDYLETQHVVRDRSIWRLIAKRSDPQSTIRRSCRQRNLLRRSTLDVYGLAYAATVQHQIDGHEFLGEGSRARCTLSICSGRWVYATFSETQLVVGDSDAITTDFKRAVQRVQLTRE